MSRYPNPLLPKLTFKTGRSDETISKWPEIQYLVFQYYDNTEYQFIGRSLIPTYPNHLRAY